MSELFEKEEGSYFEKLVGEGKKYRDQEALAKSRLEADEHINRVQAEAAELRAELQSRKTLEEMMETLRSQNQPTRETLDDRPRQVSGDEQNKPTGLTREDVAKLLDEAKKEDSRKANIEATRAGLRERYGSTYNQKLLDIAGELQVSEKFLTDMAAVSPSGFFKLVDSVATPVDKAPGSPPTSGVDKGKVMTDGTVKNKAYYDNLRKTDRKAYLSRRIQAEMHEQAVKMGPSFYA